MMTQEEYVRDAIGLLSQLIATPSTSRNEKDAADIMEKALRNYGFTPHREANNVWVISPHFDEQKPTLLLNAHIDTVKPVDSWRRDPFAPTIEGDTLYGLGSNDCGGGLCSLLQTFRMLTEKTQNYNLIYLASAEEEVSGKDGISRALPLLPKIDLAIVGEPTGMQPAVAEKGLMVLDVIAHGKSGHAARNEGVNAIYEALDDMRWIRDYKFEKVSPFLGSTKMTLTVVNAGTQHNVIPDTCTMLVDIRTNEFYDNEELYHFICQHLKSEVKAHSFRLKSSRIDPEHPLYKVCRFVERKIKYADKSNNFNLAEKFIELTRPPYGLFQSYAGMGMLAFAMRPYVNKIFDLNGKPREVQHMVEDVVEVFKSWEDGKISQKVTFRFETPEEGKISKAFIRVFNLTRFKDISEISSLKNARWVMTHSFVPEKKYPLWSLKFVSDDVAKPEVKKLVENINTICVEVGSSNPNLLSETADGIKLYEFELKNLINDADNFRKGFLAFLQTEESVKLNESEFDDAVHYISTHQQAEVGTWNESEVLNALLKWRVSTMPSVPPTPHDHPLPPVPPVTPPPTPFAGQKRQKALDKVDQISDVYQAKNLLHRIVDLGYETILDTILNN